MTQSDGRFFSPHFGHVAGAMAVIAGLALGGCTSAPEDTAPAGFAERGANTGTFPNLNIPQRAAAPQLTQEETDAKLARLRGLQQRQSPGAPVETSEERRKRLKLIGEDQAETLKVIEEN
jgi:hypothetical protein